MNIIFDFFNSCFRYLLFIACLQPPLALHLGVQVTWQVKKKQVNINEKKKRILYIKKIREHSHHNTPLM